MAKRDGFVFAIVLVFVAAVAAAFLDAHATAGQTGGASTAAAMLLPPAPRIVCAPVDPVDQSGEVHVALTFDDRPRELCPEGTAPVRFDVDLAIPVVFGEPPATED